MANPNEVGRQNFGGITLPEWELGADMLIPYGIGVIGGGASGKTTFTKQLIDTIQRSGRVGRAVLFNPTSNEDYKTLFPSPFIHEQIEKGKLEALAKEQKRISAIYKECSKLELLERIYTTWVRSAKIDSVLSQMKLAQATVLRDFERDAHMHSEQLATIRRTLADRTNDAIRSVYKSAIARFYADHRLDLGKVQPPLDEITITLMQNILLDPYLLLVFDDCGAVLKEFTRTVFMKELYFQARHVQMMSLMLLQSATQLDKNLRSNMHIIFFTSAQCVIEYFGLSGNKGEKKVAEAIVASHFFSRANNEWRVLVYNRLHSSGSAFGFVRSVPTRIERFGSDAYWQFGEECQKNQGSQLKKLLGLT